MRRESEHLIGIISDTHGLMRPEAIKVLEGSELIIHAGDVGKPQVLDELREIAPVIAVRGNVDTGEWVSSLPQTEIVGIGEVKLYVLHDLKELGFAPAAAPFAAVISGHTHRPAVTHEDEVLFLNPGSAGPRRFRLPLSVALLRVRGEKLEAKLIELKIQDVLGRRFTLPKT